MLARLVRPVPCGYSSSPVPTGTIGTVRKCLRGGLLFRLRAEPRTVRVCAGDFEPVRVQPLPPLPREPRPRALLVGRDALPTRAERAELAAAPPWVSDPEDDGAPAVVPALPPLGRRVPGWAFLALALIPLALAAVAVAVSP